MADSPERLTAEAHPGLGADLAPKPSEVGEPFLQPIRASSLQRVGWLLVALVLGVLSILWVVQNELIHSSIQVGNSVRPIPTLAAVLLMGAGLAPHRRR